MARALGVVLVVLVVVGRERKEVSREREVRTGRRRVMLKRMRTKKKPTAKRVTTSPTRTRMTPRSQRGPALRTATTSWTNWS